MANEPSDVGAGKKKNKTRNGGGKKNKANRLIIPAKTSIISHIYIYQDAQNNKIGWIKKKGSRGKEVKQP